MGCCEDKIFQWIGCQGPVEKTVDLVESRNHSGKMENSHSTRLVLELPCCRVTIWNKACRADAAAAIA